MTHNEFFTALRAKQLRGVMNYDHVLHICNAYNLSIPTMKIILLLRLTEFGLFFMMALGWAVVPWKWYVVTPLAFLCMIPISYFKEQLQEGAIRQILEAASRNESLFNRLKSDGFLNYANMSDKLNEPSQKALWQVSGSGSCENDPISLKPYDLDRMLNTYKKSEQGQHLLELLGGEEEALRGAVAEFSKLTYLSDKYGEKDVDYILGDRIYFAGNIQSQSMTIGDTKKTVYFDFSDYYG